jgi:hypothetical protein
MGKKVAVMFALVLICISANAQKGGARAPSPCKHWKAWREAQPGARATLHVTGTCEFPTAGYSVELVPVQIKKQELHPQIYALKRVTHKPEGMAAQVITEVPVDYKVETSTSYTEVRIRPDRVRVRVKKER